MIPSEIRGAWVLVHAPKSVLVLSKQQIIEALRLGKAWRRGWDAGAQEAAEERLQASDDRR